MSILGVLVADSVMNGMSSLIIQLLDCLTVLLLVCTGGFASPKLEMAMKISSTGYLMVC